MTLVSEAASTNGGKASGYNTAMLVFLLVMLSSCGPRCWQWRLSAGWPSPGLADVVPLLSSVHESRPLASLDSVVGLS